MIVSKIFIEGTCMLTKISVSCKYPTMVFHLCLLGLRCPTNLCPGWPRRHGRHGRAMPGFIFGRTVMALARPAVPASTPHPPVPPSVVLATRCQLNV